MSEESSAAGASQAEAPAARPAARTAGGKAKAKTSVPPTERTPSWTEDSLNAPSRQTVGMLAIMSTATLVFWAAGRAACNYHDAGESLSPRQVALEARTRTEKDVAMELSVSWSSADFETARQLVAGDLVQILEQDARACQGAPCEARRAARDNVFSVAEVLRRGGKSGFVRVRTVGAPGGEVTRIYELERIDAQWKATRQLPADAPLPPLEEPPAGLARDGEESTAATSP